MDLVENLCNEALICITRIADRAGQYSVVERYQDVAGVTRAVNKVFSAANTAERIVSLMHTKYC